jgi:DNA polymerase-1
MSNKLIALDIETTGLNPRKDRIHGIGVAKSDTEAAYLDVTDQNLREYLANPENHIVGHNIRFDLKFLIQAGFSINCQVWDTKLLAQLLDENQELGLKPLSQKYFGADALENKRELDRAISSINGRSVADLCLRDLEDDSEPFYHIISKYCIEDCLNTLRLFQQLSAALKRVHENMTKAGYSQTPLTYYMDETMPLEKVLLQMELSGIRVDVNKLLQFRDRLVSENKQHMAQMSLLAAKEIHAIEEDLYNGVISTKKTEKGKANVQKRSERHGTKFNWQSSDHIATLIFDRFGVPISAVEKTQTGKPSTSESSLESLHQTMDANDLLARILTTYKTWKKNVKLITTYTGDDKGLMSQIEDNRVYAEYLQAGRGKEGTTGGTVTGRLSSRNPNMQNLPRGSEIKRFFIPDEGHVFVYFDYSQLELRLAAHLSQDPLLIKAYNEGLDLHEITAQAIGADRQIGKSTNFAMIYDASAWRLADMLKKPVDECQFIISEFYNLYQGYKRYLETQRKFIQRYGCVVSATGRIRRLPDIHSTEYNTKPWKHALKQGYNFPIQSLGASITKRAMIELVKRNLTIVTQVHDSVVISLPENKLDKVQEIQHVAETIYPLSVPLKADIKLLTSLSESDIITTKESDNEQQHSNSRTNQARS